MNPEIYYHVMEIGVIYEKGGSRGDKWRWGERRRLLDECMLWRDLIRCAALEEKGVDCSEKIFSELSRICKKYKLPAYERFFSLQKELVAPFDQGRVGMNHDEVT